MVLVIPSLIENSLALEVVVQSAEALENDICCSSLHKCTIETACMFLRGVALVLVTIMRVVEKEVLRYRWSRDFR